MEDKNFWLKVFQHFLIAVVMVVMAFIGSCQATKKHVVNAIKAGATPLEASCALNNNNGTPGLCYVIAGQPRTK